MLKHIQNIVLAFSDKHQLFKTFTHKQRNFLLLFLTPTLAEAFFFVYNREKNNPP